MGIQFDDSSSAPSDNTEGQSQENGGIQFHSEPEETSSSPSSGGGISFNTGEATVGNPPNREHTSHTETAANPPPAPATTEEKKGCALETKGGQIMIDDVLEAALDLGASDLHFGANERIAFRINGDIKHVDNFPPLTPEDAERLIFSLIGNEDQKETLLRTRELDTSFVHSDGTAFRVNIYYRRKNLSAVLRAIASEAMNMDALGIPEAVLNLVKAKQGLILVTGPTGSGKSTSMQSMLQFINQTRVEHILTIEDPIEFLFTSDKCIFSQREVGVDTLSFSNALRAALREDPDIVMIGEMRDAETIMAAMNLAETGHLVISTLHTSGAPQTVSRLVNAFPPEQQHAIQGRLADSLIGVLSQRLVRRADKVGRIGIFELMIVNAAIRNIIRTGEMSQLSNAILAGRNIGMIQMIRHAEALEEEGKIRREDYIGFFQEE